MHACGLTCGLGLAARIISYVMNPKEERAHGDVPKREGA